jgi:FtsP/CotA-like multicopper oxidase with cupredoxin domain
MGMTRRQLIRLGLAGGAAAALPGLSTACGSAGSLLRSAARLPEPFTTPLPVPSVLEPVRRDAGTDYYEITQRAGQVGILPDGPTAVWGYNGCFPGPTVESRSGRRTLVTHRNELAVPTVVHLHGGRTPPEHDGYPTDLVLPASGWRPGDHAAHGDAIANGSWDYTYPVDQAAATLWYHDHRMDFTGPQVYRGLAGFHLIRSDEEEALGLPAGECDIPLMIADRAFAEDGSFHYPALDPSLRDRPGTEPEFVSGVLGDCILVNGAAWPVLEVTNTRYRFRLLNASNARRYRLALDPPPPGGTSFVQIGSDQGLLAAPVGHDRLDIAQGERFDVVIDFSGYAVGDQVTLVNQFGQGGTGLVMRFVVAHRGSDDSTVPERLADFRPLSSGEATEHREFWFARGGASAHGTILWTINGEPFDPARVDAKPALHSVERWKIHGLNVEHPFHIHLARFQVIGSHGGAPARHQAGWKDTVNLDNGGEAELLVHFDGYRGKYVLHCHNLEHEDMMMMANFEVV